MQPLQPLRCENQLAACVTTPTANLATRVLNKENSRSGVLFSIFAIFFLQFSSACAAQRSKSLTPDTVTVPAGPFIFGSDRTEREYAYDLDQKAYGHSRTRDSKWYETEADRQSINTDQFEITISPITNRQYGKFVAATQHPAPSVEPELWQSYGLVHPYERTIRHTWVDNTPPRDREDHPVVLVSYADALAYASWLTDTTTYTWRLPTEIEWVKAARGPEGWRFSWGDEFDSQLLNSHDAGPFDTVKVGSLSAPNSYGLVDTAGQVFEWIKTTPGARRAWVKGGSWDDKGCGVCRPAARHSRPLSLKHILIGFRLIKE